MEDSRRSADRDLEQARAALERGEMRRCADHIAGAIAHAPTLPETHELLSRLAARTGGALDLFPLDQHSFVGIVVSRAHLLAAAGRPEEGLPLLAAASGHHPGVDWAGVPWVDEPSLGVRMEPGLLARIVMQLCATVGDPAPEPGRETLRPYLTVVRHAIAANAGHPMLLGAGSALARRVGETTLAIEWAERGARERPSKLAEIWLGYAYRSAGRVPEALVALRRAVTHDPDDLSVYADIAGTLAEIGRLDDALDWVDRALRKDPEFDCAVHTAHRLRFRADGELSHLIALADFARDHPDDTHEHTDLADCCAGTPWLSGLPTGPQTGEPAARPRPPATERPSASAVERLTRVAADTWSHPPAAYDAALELVLLEPADLLALLAHPPAAPAGQDAAQWARLVPVWVCLGLLHHGSDEPWMTSTRRRTLIELAVGGADRITEAAIFALVTNAWIDPATRSDVGALVTGRLMGVAGPSRPDRATIAWSVAQLALGTPDLRDETRDLAASIVLAEQEAARPRIPRQRQRQVRKHLLRWLTR